MYYDGVPRAGALNRTWTEMEDTTQPKRFILMDALFEADILFTHEILKGTMSFPFKTSIKAYSRGIILKLF